jgi:hypothetical protein
MSPARRSPFVRQTRTRYPLAEIDQGERVLLILGSLRFATNIQVRRAIFDSGSSSPRHARDRATTALRRLFDSGYLHRVQVFCPSASSDRLSLQIVNVLSAAGARAIGLDPRIARPRAPKDRQVLAHDFWLTELGVLAFAGCPPGLTITHWWNDRVLAARKRRGLLWLPNISDALLVVRNDASGKDFPCFVELDLGTETGRAVKSGRRDVARKIEGYLDYLATGFQQEFGIAAVPIVLIVTDSEARSQSLRALTQELGGGGRFWFAPLPRLRGLAGASQWSETAPNAPQSPFWAPSWQTAHSHQWRSLAVRCGLSGTLRGTDTRAPVRIGGPSDMGG